MRIQVIHYFLNGKKEGYLKYFYEDGRIRALYRIKNDTIRKKISFHKNGLLQNEIYYKNGKKEGKFITFDIDGSKINTGNYRNGVLDGENIIYENGKEKNIYNFKNGVKNGYALEYIENKIKNIYHYKNGHLDGIQIDSNKNHSFCRNDFQICFPVKEKKECCICWENSSWETECKHAICKNCIPLLQNMSCPMCRKEFSKFNF